MRFEPGLKLARHKRLVDYLNGEKIFPINIEISPSGICNAHCDWCFYKDSPDNHLIDTKLMLKTIKELESFAQAITWTGGGEPTLHPDFRKFIKTNLKQGLFTNGLKVNYDPSIFEWIRVSKTDKDWPVKNIKKLRKCKTLGMCINYLGNDEAIKEGLKVARKVKADYLQVRPALNVGNNLTFVKRPNLQDKLLLLTDYKFEECSKERTYDRCEGFHFVPFIWQDGDVDVCAYHKGDKKFNLGNLYQNDLMSILQNAPEYVKVKDCQICCKNHEINKLISNMRKLEDVAFV